MISWYNNSVKKRGDIQKDIKKDDRLVASLYDHLFYVFFMSFFCTPPFLYTVIIPRYHYNYNLFFTFCSRIVNIIADIFVLHRVFVYKSWTIYKIQNIQNTKFFADSELQNSKFILFLDKIFFLEHLNYALNKGYC